MCVFLQQCSVLGLQLMGLLGLRVQELGITGVLGWAGQVRSLPRVILMDIHGVAGADKVESYLVDCLTLIESDFNSSLSGADALQVILVDLGGHDVLHVGDSLKRLLVEVLGQASHIDVDDLLLGEVLLLVVFLGVVARE